MNNIWLSKLVSLCYSFKVSVSQKVLGFNAGFPLHSCETLENVLNLSEPCSFICKMETPLLASTSLTYLGGVLGTSQWGPQTVFSQPQNCTPISACPMEGGSTRPSTPTSFLLATLALKACPLYFLSGTFHLIFASSLLNVPFFFPPPKRHLGALQFRNQGDLNYHLQHPCSLFRISQVKETSLGALKTSTTSPLDWLAFLSDNDNNAVSFPF